MQFLVFAYDAKDAGAYDRRMAVREAHIATIDRYMETNNMIYGGALLDDDGKMIGSAIIAEFPSRQELDGWLAEEPYITGKVWDDVKIIPFKTGPTFVK